MEKVIAAIENICSLTKAEVDRNYGQGWEAVSSQLAIRMAEDEEPPLVDKLMADKYIVSFRNTIQKLKDFVSPHQLLEFR